jgi:hypothetical protein
MPDIQPSPKAQSIAASAIAGLTASFKIVNPGVGEGRPGDDFNRRTTPEEELRYLEGKGWTLHGEDSAHYRLTRPGKAPCDGCSATLSKSSPPILYVFSSEASPFEPNKGFPPFVTRALLEHGGDYSATARALGQKGFGEQKNSGASTRASQVPAALRQSLVPAAAAASKTEPAPTRLVFEFVHNADILADLRPVEWRIRDVLTDYSLYYNFGDPGHFKTFVELDRLLCIASGTPYHGHPVKQGTVFYICGEGFQGIGRRIAAWHIARGTRAEEIPFFVSRTPTELMALGAVENVCRAVEAMAKEFGPPAVVQFDTLARNFGGGDENATKDMNTVISNLDKAFGTFFCRGLTHHTGHGNKERARGAMALHGAADGAFKVSLTPSGQIAVECKKLKDAAAAPMMLFDRREILLQIGDVEDRSYVLDLRAEGGEAVSIAKPKTATALKGNLSKALETLRRLYARHAENLKKGGRLSVTPLVLYSDWRTACSDAGLYPRTDNFRRAAEQIILSGFAKLEESGKYVQLIEQIEEGDE